MLRFPEINLRKSFIAHIEAIVGPDGYSVKDTDRLSYSRDANFRSAIAAHYSHFENFPSLIVWPQNVEQLSLVIKAAVKYRVPVTPYGGGSGVCGGAVSYQGGIIVDMKLLNKILRLDEDKLFIDVQAGILGLPLQNQLERQGFTLGHFPSSILSATLGGYLAARSAGQMSSKYGKIEDLVIDLEFVDGTGHVHQTSDVSRARGIDFTQSVVGSEGTLGLITRARLKIFPLPKDRVYHSVSFPKMSNGMEALRRIMQTGIKPDVLRLYDEIDSLVIFSKSDESSFQKPSQKILSQTVPSGLKDALSYAKSTIMPIVFRSHRLIDFASRFSWAGCVLVIMLEGHRTLIDQELKIISSICQDMGGVDCGVVPAQNWHKHRYSVSYKASRLFEEGAFTDTMEVATSWDHLEGLYRAVRRAVSPYALVLAHISHVYADGAAIYFTFVAPLTGLKSSLKTFDRIWDVAQTATLKHHGVVSHHHGVGRLKKKYLREQWGEALTLYQRLKAFFDPHDILNPNILVGD